MKRTEPRSSQYVREVGERREERKPEYILSESEYMLLMKRIGDEGPSETVKIGELGNPRYPDRPDKFVWIPEDGLLVNGENQRAELSPADLWKLRRGLGYVPLGEVLGPEDAEFSGLEFNRREHALCEAINRKIDALKGLGNLVGQDYENIQEWDSVLKQTAREHPHWSPKDIFHTMLAGIDKKADRPISKEVDHMGILSTDPRESTLAVVPYFYLCLRTAQHEQGFDTENPAHLQEFLIGDHERRIPARFPARFTEELLTLYEERERENFGGPLLIACSNILRGPERDEPQPEEE